MSKRDRRARRANRQRGERFRTMNRAAAEAQDPAQRARARYARGESVGRCPLPCGKVAAPSLDAAKTIRARIGARHGAETPVSYYECRVTPGIWHWTRQQERPRWMEKN